MSAVKSVEVVQPLHSPLPVNSQPGYNDEIDLISLLTTIFKRKYTVLAWVLAALLCAGVYVGLMPQRWTSSASLVPAEAAQLSSMTQLQTDLAVLDIKNDITAEKLLSHFIRAFDSRSLRKKFLISTPYFRELETGNEQNVNFRNQTISTIINNDIDWTSSEQDKNKKDYHYYKVKFSAKTPEAARELLQGYIHYVTGIVQNEVRLSLRYQVDLLKGQAQGRYQRDLQRAQNNQRIKIERLQYALDIARSAGLQRPSWSKGNTIQDDPDFSVTLGVDGLERKLEIEKALPDAAHLNAELQNRRDYIARLDALKIGELSVQPFKYLSVPDTPVKKEGPRRSLVLMLAGLLGLLAGCGYVLLRHLLQERRKMDQLETLDITDLNPPR